MELKKISQGILSFLLLFIAVALIVGVLSGPSEKPTGEFLGTREEATIPTTTEEPKSIFPKTLTQQHCPTALRNYLGEDVKTECDTNGFECIATDGSDHPTYCHAGYNQDGDKQVEIYEKVDYGLGYPVKKLLKIDAIG